MKSDREMITSVISEVDAYERRSKMFKKRTIMSIVAVVCTLIALGTVAGAVTGYFTFGGIKTQEDLKDNILNEAALGVNTVYCYLLAIKLLVFMLHGNGYLHKLAVVFGKIGVKAHVARLCRMLGGICLFNQLQNIFRDCLDLFFFHFKSPQFRYLKVLRELLSARDRVPLLPPLRPFRY